MSSGPAQAGLKPARVRALSQVGLGGSWEEYQVEETGLANLLHTRVAFSASSFPMSQFKWSCVLFI